MFLASKSRSNKSEQFWSNLGRIGIGFIVAFSLLLDSLTMSTRPGTIIIGGLFLGWGYLAVFWGKFWQRPAQIAGAIAFVDLAFSSAIVVFCHGLSLVWLPVLFLLPAVELSSLYATVGVAFVLLAFIWTVILSGLMNLALFQQPLWWIVALLWGAFILFTAILQAIRMGHIRPTTRPEHKQAASLVTIDEQPEYVSEEDHWQFVHTRLATIIPQIATAFELPFRHMGVHTEEHRPAIEAALNTLYSPDGDHEALSLCLDQLLQATKQNWIGLAAFSPREQEILELLLQNCTYKEMGFRLHVSQSTIKTHIYHIFQKLDVSNRDEAMRLIHQRGWFFANLRTPPLLEAAPRS